MYLKVAIKTLKNCAALLEDVLLDFALYISNIKWLINIMQSFVDLCLIIYGYFFFCINITNECIICSFFLCKSSIYVVSDKLKPTIKSCPSDASNYTSNRIYQHTLPLFKDMFDGFNESLSRTSQPQGLFYICID